MPEEKFGYIDLFKVYQNARTNAPEIYGIHLSIQLIGHTLSRNSICNIQPRAVTHNINLCLLGPSGCKKSTAQEIIENIYPDDVKGTKHFTPEGLLRLLEEQPQTICPLGEFSTLLRGIKDSSYLVNFKEISNDLFNCPSIYKKRLSKKSDSYELKEPYLSMNSTCTEEEFFFNVTKDMVHGGFLPRWLLINGDAKYRKRCKLDNIIYEFERVFKNIINTLYNYFRKNPLNFELDEAALEVYDKICKELSEDPIWENIQPFVTRYANYIITYADIILVSDMIGEVTLAELTRLAELTKINMPYEFQDEGILNVLVNLVNPVNLGAEYIERAWVLIKPQLEYAKKIVKYVDEDQILAKLEQIIDRYTPLTKSDALRRTHLKSTEFSQALITLTEREYAFKFEIIYNRMGLKTLTIICKRTYKETDKCNSCRWRNNCNSNFGNNNR